MKLTSPFPQFPGQIIIPDDLDAQDFNQWWQRLCAIDEDEEETRHNVFQIWDGRFHFIQSHTIELPDGYALEQTGLKLPTPVFANWFIEETNDLLSRANSLKNYQGLSGDT